MEAREALLPGSIVVKPISQQGLIVFAYGLPQLVFSVQVFTILVYRNDTLLHFGLRPGRTSLTSYRVTLMNQTDSILVTGGTGTFGLAFLKFLLVQTKVQRIVCYSRGEHAQAAAKQALAGLPGASERLRWMVGDVRDEKRLLRACRGCDTVVHAAALKRIETGQYNPDEMVRTNVLGTMNVIEAAVTAGVKRVVGLSSDKAYQPISPYGQSKALGESLMLAANDMYGTRTRFACTRYGNIWKAQGSVVPRWEAAVAAGANFIEVTDPHCTRFFMTIDEAVQLVWDLVKTMRGGELVIPEWLPAYSLDDLAYAFCDVHGVAMKVTGLPQFEKRHESMHKGLCSDSVPLMSIDELKGWLQ